MTAARREHAVIESPGDGKFSIAEARRIVKDLFRPDPRIYWVDFLCHMALGWGAFIFTVHAPLYSARQGLAFTVSVLALYRAVIFIHELAHLKRNTFQIFRRVWNITCGFPLMTPSFTYDPVHIEHHRTSVYGTKADGEYAPFGTGGRAGIVLYLALALVTPLLFAFRFIVLTPLCTLSSRLRSQVWQRYSSLALDPDYRRPMPSSREEAGWRLQESAAFLYGSFTLVLVASGVLSYKVPVLWYLLTLMIFLLNSIRTLAAHRYQNLGAREMGLSEQFLDSVNIPGNRFLTALWAPVGLRYHATHHLFPALPYHALGRAHRRLLRQLPDKSFYLRTVRKSLWEALLRLWRDAGSARSETLG